jgi:hypothetical protein
LLKTGKRIDNGIAVIKWGDKRAYGPYDMVKHV